MTPREAAAEAFADYLRRLDEPKTFHEMAEAVEKVGQMQKRDGTKPTAAEIFNSSPTGELFQVAEWYRSAVRIQVTVGKLKDLGVDAAFFDEFTAAFNLTYVNHIRGQAGLPPLLDPGVPAS